MASYYKYAERDVANEIDWRAITGEITQNMKDIEKAREDKRVAIQKASGDAMKRMMEKPQGEDFLENNRVANYAQQAQEIQLENLRLLKRGDISEREYSLRFNNLTTGTDMVFNLSQEYQDSYQMHMDRMANGEASGIEGDLLGMAEQYGNPKDSQYYINPLTGEVNLARTKEDGETGQVTIGDSQFDLMSLGTARNIIFQKINKYQTQTQVKGLVEGLKTEVNEALGTGALKGYITKEKGLDIDGLFETKDGKLVPSTDEGKAILASINATFAGDDFSRASFLFDTVKTIDGEVVELVMPDPEGNFPELKNNQIKMVLNNQNRYVPEITDEQNRIIEKNMVGLIKSGIDKEFGIKADTRKTQSEEENLQLRRQELLERAKARKEKGLEKVKSTIMDDARRYLEENIKESVLSLEDDEDVFTAINEIISEFGIELRNPVNFLSGDGQSLILSQTNEKGDVIENEILLPSTLGTSKNWFGPARPTAKASKEQMINFILENVNARALAAIKDKFGGGTNNENPALDDNEDDLNAIPLTKTRTVTIDYSKK